MIAHVIRGIASDGEASHPVRFDSVATPEPGRLPAFARVLLVDPEGVARGLERVRAAGLVRVVPNRWQVALGVARMWHRVLFRSETIGTSHGPTRATWRARLLAFRPLRFPFLLREKAVAPLDFSGLLSSEERVLSHLCGAHHDGDQFAYDLELLETFPGALERLERRAATIVEGRDPRAAWLRDLVVFEGYHEELLLAARDALTGTIGRNPSETGDPDLRLRGYLDWCARQPATPEATWERALAGRFTIAQGVVA